MLHIYHMLFFAGCYNVRLRWECPLLIFPTLSSRLLLIHRYAHTLACIQCFKVSIGLLVEKYVESNLVSYPYSHTLCFEASCPWSWFDSTSTLVSAFSLFISNVWRMPLRNQKLHSSGLTFGPAMWQEQWHLVHCSTLSWTSIAASSLFAMCAGCLWMPVRIFLYACWILWKQKSYTISLTFGLAMLQVQ